MRKGIILVIASMAIILLILGVIINSAIMMLKSIPHKENILPKPLQECEIIPHATGSRNIVLRIDDIQAYYLTDIQKKIINDIINRGKTASLSVIPKGIESDKDMFEFMKDKKCYVEIALHGYDHSYGEFENAEAAEVKQRIETGLNILHKITKEVVTFVPPNNLITENEEKVLMEEGFKIISAGHWNSKFGFTQTTYDWVENKLNSAEQVLEGCKKDLEEDSSCIIMIHPQDYATNNQIDEKKYAEFVNLLNGIDMLNAKVVTFSDLSRTSSNLII